MREIKQKVSIDKWAKFLKQEIAEFERKRQLENKTPADIFYSIKNQATVTQQEPLNPV